MKFNYRKILQTDKLLTVRQVAEILAVSDQTVRKAIAAGNLTAINCSLGGSKYKSVRIRKSDLDAYLLYSATGEA